MDPLDDDHHLVQLNTSLDNIVVQIHTHAEQLEAHHLICAPSIVLSITARLAKTKHRMFATTCTSSEAIFCCIRKTHKWERLQNCAACFSGLLCLPISFYTRSPTYVATVKCRVAGKKTLQLTFFEWSLCYRLLTGDMETALHLQLMCKGASCRGQRKRAYQHQMVSWLQMLINW